MKRLIIVGIFSLSLNAETFHYVCEDDYKFSATYQGKNLKIKLARQSSVLKPVPSASGAKYSDGKITLHNKSNEALLYLDDFIPFHCSSDFKPSEVKAVKNVKSKTHSSKVIITEPINTVTHKHSNKGLKKSQRNKKTTTTTAVFSAFGNDPQWQLRLSKDKGDLLYDDGKAFKFKLPKRRQSGDSILYFYKSQKRNMMIELHNHHCFDSITKKEYSTTVSIKINARSFVGCGE